MTKAPPHRLRRVAILLVVCYAITFFSNVLYHWKIVEEHHDRLLGPDRGAAGPVAAAVGRTSRYGAALSCAAHGGPADRIASEMIYWSDVKSDAGYVSPFHPSRRQEEEPVFRQPKYLSFEPDEGGFNNIRMGMETVLVLAVASGRTLVLPPSQEMYLLMQNRGRDNTQFSFADFFPLRSLHEEHPGFDIITTEEFLRREGVTGNLVDRETGQVRFPPRNRTDWDQKGAKSLPEHRRELDAIRGYMRSVGFMPHRTWNPDRCLAVFPATTKREDLDAITDAFGKMKKEMPRWNDFVGKPTPVNAAFPERMREVISGRRGLCLYDEDMQKEKLIHFKAHIKDGARLLIHFYAFAFFQDWKTDLWAKRFVRDHVRYSDEIQCAASRMVNALRRRARERNPRGNPNGLFDAFHIRRGDFQFKEHKVPIDVIYENTREELMPNGTIYIATDETDRSVFKPLADRYDVFYLSDFDDLIEHQNKNYYGMLDQLVASRARRFFGTPMSTFTNYINRMRGYHTEQKKLEGYRDGAIESYYFSTASKKYEMRQYVPVHSPYFSREFPASWRDIDKGIAAISV